MENLPYINLSSVLSWPSFCSFRTNSEWIIHVLKMVVCLTGPPKADFADGPQQFPLNISYRWQLCSTNQTFSVSTFFPIYDPLLMWSGLNYLILTTGFLPELVGHVEITRLCVCQALKISPTTTTTRLIPHTVHSSSSFEKLRAWSRRRREKKRIKLKNIYIIIIKRLSIPVFVWGTNQSASEKGLTMEIIWVSLRDNRLTLLKYFFSF